jgi:hypothetical protein
MMQWEGNGLLTGQPGITFTSTPTVAQVPAVVENIGAVPDSLQGTLRALRHRAARSHPPLR